MTGAALLTGGCGFLGRKLASRLLADGMFSVVILYDIQPPRDPLAPGEQYVQGRTQEQEHLQKVLQQHVVSVVFHIAAYGMSGVASLDKAKTWEVNVLGTRSVLAACVAAGVPRLIYTSTCNVVFGGQPIHGADESMPYYPPHKQLDYYSSSKTIAEMTVLAANGTLLAATSPSASSSNSAFVAEAAAATQSSTAATAACQQQQQLQPRLLRTCALRPNGIYGAGEQQHSMRLLKLAEQGLLVASFGSPDAVQDWTHIDNLVQAQVLAAAGLTEERGYVAAGQAYFIVDPAPANSQRFMAPLLEGLGYTMPAIRLPYWLVFSMACMGECLYHLLPERVGFRPMFTRNEIRKACITHYFSYEKAVRELQYHPKPNSAADYLPWFMERGYGRKGRRQAPGSLQQQRQG